MRTHRRPCLTSFWHSLLPPSSRRDDLCPQTIPPLPGVKSQNVKASFKSVFSPPLVHTSSQHNVTSCLSYTTHRERMWRHFWVKTGIRIALPGLRTVWYQLPRNVLFSSSDVSLREPVGLRDWRRGSNRITDSSGLQTSYRSVICLSSKQINKKSFNL